MSPIVIESREHLVNMLAEAAEIEHNLMCCYLYAAFSLKEGVEEGLTASEAEAVARWRREIIHVGVEEMTHLALVSNLISALGGVPHLARPNFPVAAGYHPAGIVVQLAAFDQATLEHFIFLERPDDAKVSDGAGFAPAHGYTRTAFPGRLMPTSHDYDTVGALYRGIREGFERLAAQFGADALFVGDPQHQLGPDVTNLPGLVRVRCLKTALAAIESIVIQGEGAADASTTSHYQRFRAIHAELEQLQKARPAFDPGRPAARNPVMRQPVIAEDRVWVALQPAASLIDLANSVYAHMLRLLAQAYAETRGVDAQRPFIEAATDLMVAITPVASALTRLPANEQRPGCNAGMSFATVRAGAALPASRVADGVLLERQREIVARAEQLKATLPWMGPVATRLARIGERLARDLGAATAAPSGDEPAVASPTAATPAAEASAGAKPSIPVPIVLPDGSEAVEGKAVTLLFDSKRCIHARHCVLGQPAVFKANVQGPWLDPDACSAEAMATVAHMCPSGAIHYRRKDGGAEEPVPPVNLAQLRENGPLGLRGDIRIDGASIGYRATLCRCGASANKPFCDGSHNTVTFSASGEPPTRASEPLAARGGPLEVRPQTNGPLAVRGNLEICAGTGRTVDRVTEARLCRCGASANKPFCDGSHARVGFRAD